MPKSSKTIETEALIFPEIDNSSILSDNQVQEAIGEYAKNTTKDQYSIKEFYQKGLEQLFEKQETTINNFVKIFNQVVDIEKAKKDSIEIIEKYSKYYGDEDVEESLQKLDEQINDMSPIFARIKRILEKGVNFFDKLKYFFASLFGGNVSKDIITSALLGLKGRINSIDTAFKKYEEQLQTNQETCKKFIPELGQQAYQIDVMEECLQVVKKSVKHEKTKDFLNVFISQLQVISGLKKSNLQRFLLSARMNGNTQLLLKATQFKVFSVTPSLLALNFVLAGQNKINELSKITDEFLKEMIEHAKEKIKSSMNAQIEAKKKMKEQLQQIVENIKWLNQKIKWHKKEVSKAQKAIDSYIPIYKKRIEELEKNIVIKKGSEEFDKISKAIIEKFDDASKEIESEIEKSKKLYEKEK